MLELGRGRWDVRLGSWSFAGWWGVQSSFEHGGGFVPVLYLEQGVGRSWMACMGKQLEEVSHLCPSCPAG